MIELWGHPSCESCEAAKNLLLRTPLVWRYVTVGKDFVGTIPRIRLDDGSEIVGYPFIRQYVENVLREYGYRI